MNRVMRIAAIEFRRDAYRNMGDTKEYDTSHFDASDTPQNIFLNFLTTFKVYTIRKKNLIYFKNNQMCFLHFFLVHFKVNFTLLL